MIPAIAAFLALSAQGAGGGSVPLRDNGFCAGLAWVTLAPGQTVALEQGPDFDVYRVSGPGGFLWGVYSGRAGQSRPDRTLTSRDGTAIRRGTRRSNNGDGDGQFNGYVVASGAAQNHFFGGVFRDHANDARFFDQVRLGQAAARLCAAQR